MINIEVKGSFRNTFNFFNRTKKFKLKDLEKYGEMGVEELRKATPMDTGRTAYSWYYTITEENGQISLNFLNSNLGDGWAPIAILLQYGHATGTGGWVEGVDYINPALRPIFEEIARKAWLEVTA